MSARAYDRNTGDSTVKETLAADAAAPDDGPSTPKHSRTGHQQYREKLVKDTPAIVRSIFSPDYQDGDVESMRDSVIRDLGPTIPEVSLDQFVDNFLPRLQDGIDIAAVVSLLEQENIFSARDKVLEDFRVSPSKQQAHEDKVFYPLAAICESICRLALASVPQLRGHRNFLLAVLPYYTPTSERNSSTRPDALLYCKDKVEFAQYVVARDDETKKERARRTSIKMRMELSGKGIQWYDIGASFEFKKDSKGSYDNIRKLLFHMQQMLTLDPCRRFSFGITIEDKLMRLWFCSRSNPAVSTEFDFTTDINRLVHIILALSFASKEDLGWDPTIRPLIRQGRRRAYSIQVGGKTFQTEEVLSDVAADNLLSNATRVWRGTESGSQNPVIVKDLWIDASRCPEHLNYQAMLNDVEARFGVAVREDVASHFLTPIVFGNAFVDGREDHTTDVMMRGFNLSYKQQLTLEDKKRENDEKKRSVNHPIASDLIRQQAQNVKLTEAEFTSRFLIARKHYRIVFKEVAVNIHHITSLSDVFVVLRDSVKALTWVHQSGWVHRDLSVGNLYFYNGRGVIGDLEYAKLKFSKSSHYVRTGSTYFMAVEVIKQSYNYGTPGEKSEGGIDALLKGFADENFQEELDQTFLHNDLHDLESLWWITIYIIFFNYDDSDSRSNEDETATSGNLRRTVASQLFPGTEDTHYRRDFLSNQHTFKQGMAWIPSELLKIKTVLDLLRITLVQKYSAYESKLPDICLEALQGIHEEFYKAFDGCIQLADGIDLKPCKPARPLKIGTVPIVQEIITAHPQSSSNCTLSSLSQSDSEEPHSLEPNSPTPSARKKRRVG
ncbi:hypothetical protein ACEPAG_9447 [Sanghuangporus baumii]